MDYMVEVVYYFKKYFPLIVSCVNLNFTNQKYFQWFWRNFKFFLFNVHNKQLCLGSIWELQEESWESSTLLNTHPQHALCCTWLNSGIQWRIHNLRKSQCTNSLSLILLRLLELYTVHNLSISLILHIHECWSFTRYTIYQHLWFYTSMTAWALHGTQSIIICK